jgi:hypothetical protein
MTTATKPTSIDLGGTSRSAAPHRRMTATATVTAAELTSTTAVHARRAPSQPDKTAAITAVNHLERLLFDGDGHRRRHTSPERADRLLWAINELRGQLGWLRLDMQHHHRWPDNA